MKLSPDAWALADLYQATFTTDGGRRILADLETFTGFFEPLPPVGSLDPVRLGVKAGMREVYTHILTQLRYARDPQREIAEVTGAVDAFGDLVPKETA